jgi:hypothetical protein
VVGELVRQLLAGVERIVLDDNGTKPQYCVEGHHVLRAVRQDESDPVPGANTEPSQSLRAFRDLQSEPRVGGGGAEEVERDQRPEAADRFVEQIGQGLLRNLDVERYPGCVARCPGAFGDLVHARAFRATGSSLWMPTLLS